MRQVTKPDLPVSEKQISKLPMRQVTDTVDHSVTRSISKLPMRQVTITGRGDEPELISKLPMRQVTGGAGRHPEQSISKLPMRQVTLPRQTTRPKEISKLPMRQVTQTFQQKFTKIISKLPMRQVTIKNRKDSAVLSDRFFPFFILTIFICLCKHTAFIVFLGGSKNLGQIFLFYLSRKFLCKKYFIIHNEKRHSFECLFLYQQLPILPGRFRPSTFGVCELNFRVRYGYGWILTALATES